jgi:pilus assembly protein CpaF
MNQTAPNLKVAVDWKQEAGPLKPLLNDTSVTEIMVNRWDKIFIERSGVIEETRLKFENADALMRFIATTSVAVGRELNRRIPYLEGAFPDGTRITIVISPIAVDGPSITIRKPARAAPTYKDLVSAGSINDKAVYFLHQTVMAKQNIIISGGTGSGKTTLMSVLSSFIGPSERVISIEDTPELQVQVKNIVRLETRPAIGSEPGINMDELVKSALRMRPDRIIIGECRGAEVQDMLMAMNTGHAGSMTTVHANSTEDALRRIESMMFRSGSEAPSEVIENDIANTVDFIIQIVRAFDGRRRITQITEIAGRNERGYVTNDIFHYTPDRGLRSTGVTPKFVAEKSDQRINLPPDFFHPEKEVTLG